MNRPGSGGHDLTTAIALLPTPRATDGTKGSPNQRGSSGDLMLPGVVHLLPTPSVADATGGHVSQSGARKNELLLGGIARQVHTEVDWGKYAAAVYRWEVHFGRPAPDPTITGARGARVLSPFLVEWMMGVPEGLVTATEGLTRNQMLKLLGNGVVPQQAEHAIRGLVPRLYTELELAA